MLLYKVLIKENLPVTRKMLARFWQRPPIHHASYGIVYYRPSSVIPSCVRKDCLSAHWVDFERWTTSR